VNGWDAIRTVPSVGAERCGRACQLARVSGIGVMAVMGDVTAKAHRYRERRRSRLAAAGLDGAGRRLHP